MLIPGNNGGELTALIAKLITGSKQDESIQFREKVLRIIVFRNILPLDIPSRQVVVTPKKS